VRHGWAAAGLAPVWSSTTDDGPFNGALERPALRELVSTPLAGASVLDAGCGSGGNASGCSTPART
jgi:2-polyprenyl-3-methyl-5-hydroxy-6-metoxy-1,4-benzoquinol methylase